MKVGDLATFDNPENQYARWGRILEIKNSKVKLSYMGWRSIEDIRCIQISISEVWKIWLELFIHGFMIHWW